MKIGDRIKRRRLYLGYSVDEVAEMLGKNRATIYRYESNEIENLPITTLEPLAKALNTTPAYLMGWSDDAEEVLLDSSVTFSESLLVDAKLSKKHAQLLSDYESLDDYGKETVDIVLERELNRCQNMDIKLNAAHELPNATEEGKSRDNDKIYKMLRDKK